ncbi:armadillo repeat-containing protein 7-like [Corticium candelabrum]|uniref:armadillo repeat-containing protein 7-like n=1 Tax=Corticium candelabrum TaxID=121492 RepID=UPI002E2587B3|nr:armadillo repeat-containing protein 7-like [Corticium candelabrum]
MFSSHASLKRRTGGNGTDRFQFIQSLVSEFQDTSSKACREQIVANLANFAYDPINYEHLRRLNVLDLFLDMLSEDNETLVEFAIGGICNLCLDPLNRHHVVSNSGIPLIVQCLASSNEETVLSAMLTMKYLETSETRQQIRSDPVVECMTKYSSSSNARLRNLATVFLQDGPPTVQ